MTLDDIPVIAAVPVFGFIAGMLGTALIAYDSERIPYHVGTYAWELSRPRLLEAGVPPVRQGLPLTGDGVRDRKTGPDDLARLSGDADWNRLGSLRLWRVGIASMPWAVLSYGIGIAVVVILWGARTLWESEDAAIALYALWSLVALLVLFNPLLALVANQMMRTVKLSRHRRLEWIISAVITVPLALMGMYYGVVGDAVSGLLMIAGSIVGCAVAWVSLKLWLYGVGEQSGSFRVFLFGWLKSMTDS